MRQTVGALVLAGAVLAGCNIIPYPTGTTYDLPPDTLARATATLALDASCTSAECTANLLFPSRPDIIVSTGAVCAAYDLASGEPVWTRPDIACSFRGWQDDYDSLLVQVTEEDGSSSLLTLDTATGALFDRDGIDFTETHTADLRERIYQSTIDCLEPEGRMPGQPLFSGGTWEGAICSLVMEDEASGDPVVALPLGYDQIGDGHELRAFSSPDGDWVVIVDNHGTARSFRVEDL